MSHFVVIRSRPRQGAVLVVALVALLVVMALLGTMLLNVVQSRRQLRIERDARQCALLLGAAMDRAAYQLHNDSAYRGETWTIPADAQRSGAALVTITLTPSDDQSQRHAEIVAEYPAGSERSVRRSFTGSLTVRSATPEEN